MCVTVFAFFTYYLLERDIDREIVPTPYLLILGGMSSGIQAVWPPRVAVLFQFGRALLRNQRALSGKPMYDPGLLASWYRRRDGSVLCRWDDLGRRQNLQL